MYVALPQLDSTDTLNFHFLQILQIEDQLKRLLTQLQDIEEMKEDLDEDEYNSTRQVFRP